MTRHAPMAATGRLGRRNTLFTVGFWVAMVAGALVMALVLLASGAPAALAVGVVLAALPVGPLIASFLWLDRYEPEPLGLLAAALGWGALVATAAALVLQVVGQVTLMLPESWAAAFVAPVTEEAAKGLFVVALVVARRHEIDGVLDGIVYAGMVGVGFAFTENILYLAAAYTGGDELGPGGLGAATATFVLRGVFSPFAHPFFTAAIGIGVGYALATRSPLLRFLAPVAGYLVAVAAHGLWNASALMGGGQLFVLTYLFLMVPAFLLLVAFAVWARYREGRMLARALADAADRGLIAHHEIPWIARLPQRRALRRWALDQGGPAAARAVSDYQQEAIELGFLHSRYLRGTPPEELAGRVHVLIGRLRSLRPYVPFPAPGTNRVTGPYLEGGR